MKNHNYQTNYNHNDNYSVEPAATPVVPSSTPLVSYQDNVNHINQHYQSDTTAQEVPVRHRGSSFDSFDDINPRSQRNRDNGHNRSGAPLKKAVVAIGGVALAWALANGANAVVERLAPLSVEPSDESLVLHQNETWWDYYDKLTTEWNESHPEHPITVDQMGAAFDRVNEVIDRDHDGAVDMPQPGDTKIVPKLSITTLLGKKG